MLVCDAAAMFNVDLASVVLVVALVMLVGALVRIGRHRQQR
jgi:hypothetical protein